MIAAMLTLVFGLLAFAGPAVAATIPLAPLADTWVSSSAPDTPRGGNTTLEIGGFGSADERQAYLRFNGSIPAGAVVTRTTLRVYFDNAPSGDYNLRLANPFDGAWDEATITWNTRLTITGPVSANTNSIAAGYSNISVPLLRPGTPITYVLTRTGAEGALIQSKEHANKPQLLVEYEMPGTTPSSVCSGIGCVISSPRLTTMSWGTTVADFNGDGREDHLVTRHESNQDQIQLQQTDGSFTPGFRLDNGDRHGCTAGDVDGDTRIDFYCMLGADGGEGLGLKKNELWIAQSNGTYIDQAETWNVTNTNGRGRRPLLFDFTKDGRPDLYVTNFNPTGGASGNSLYINVDGTHFEERVVSATGDLGASCVDDGDWDQDRYRDFLVCGNELNLFHNSGLGNPTQTTEQRNTLLGSAVPFPRDATLADVNGDGWDDLVVITRTQLQIRLNHRELVNRFSVVDFSAALVDGNSVSVGDLTGDGAQDVYVVEGIENALGGPQNASDKLFTGPNWSQLPIPQADVGTGDNSESITVLGRKALIVTNGRDFARGPIQLVSFQPATPPPPPPPGPDPAPPPPPGPVGTTKLTKLPKAADVVQLPSTRPCATKRSVRIRIKPAGGVKFVSADVFVNGKRVKVVKQKLTRAISLRRLPKRKFTIKVVVTTGDGRKLSRSAKYRPCAKK